LLSNTHNDAARIAGDGVSGQVGMTSDGQVLDAVLDAAGLTPADLAKLTIYLTDPADVEAFMGAAAGGLPSPPPAITMLIVNGLASPELRVEIEAIAAG
jgi:2-iminobutanoate/2-iminopropanoate deaminase